VISTVPYLITFAGTKETNITEKKEKFTIREGIIAAAKNKPFLMAVLLYLLTITAFEVTSVMTFYFFKYSLGVKESADVFLGIMFISAVFSIPLWNFASAKLDKTKAFIIGIGATILLRIVISVLQPGTPVMILYLLMVLGGVAFAAGQTLPWAIIPDTIEYDEYLTGQRHEGIFYSFMQLARGIAVSVAIPGVLLLLDLSGYSGNVLIQPETADRMIRILFGGVPALLFALAIVAAILYPLNREKFRTIQDALEKKANENA
jgi:glycoside/pentoside/hexuronide:cation symporter, GPH family